MSQNLFVGAFFCCLVKPKVRRTKYVNSWPGQLKMLLYMHEASEIIETSRRICCNSKGCSAATQDKRRKNKPCRKHVSTQSYFSNLMHKKQSLSPKDSETK